MGALTRRQLTGCSVMARPSCSRRWVCERNRAGHEKAHSSRAPPGELNRREVEGRQNNRRCLWLMLRRGGRGSGHVTWPVLRPFLFLAAGFGVRFVLFCLTRGHCLVAIASDWRLPEGTPSLQGFYIYRAAPDLTLSMQPGRIIKMRWSQLQLRAR